jgi:hypothetical protein
VRLVPTYGNKLLWIISLAKLLLALNKRSSLLHKCSRENNTKIFITFLAKLVIFGFNKNTFISFNFGKKSERDWMHFQLWLVIHTTQTKNIFKNSFALVVVRWNFFSHKCIWHLLSDDSCCKCASFWNI